MGLSLGPLKCASCNSRNTEMIKLHVYKCHDCKRQWTDPLAEFAKNLHEGLNEQATILAQKLGNRF